MLTYTKDILRTIKNNSKRFVALMIITALGLTAFSGIYAACRDYYISADRFYDEQKLFDIRVLSTLGLTENDVASLQALDSVDLADGSFRKMVKTNVENLPQHAEVVMISPKGLNAPHLILGRMPNKAGEIAVNQRYLTASGKQIGDTLDFIEPLDTVDNQTSEEAIPTPTNEPADTEDDETFSVNTTEETTPDFKQTSFTIVASVTDPMNIANSEGTAAFRFITAAEYTFFVLPVDIDTDVYTSVYLTLKDVAPFECYSPEYTSAVSNAIDEINKHIKSQREQARYDEIMSKTTDTLTDAENEMIDKFSETDTEIADAWAELEQARADLTDGEESLTQEERDALQKITDAKKELAEAKAKLEDSEKELATTTEELNASIQAATAGQTELDNKRSAANTEFDQVEATLKATQDEIEKQYSQQPKLGEQWPKAEWDNLRSASATATLSQLQADPNVAPNATAVAAATTSQQNTLSAVMLAAGLTPAEINDAVQVAISYGMVDGSQLALNAQVSEYNTKRANAEREFDAAQIQINDGQIQLDAAKTKIDDGQKQIDDGWREYRSGLSKLDNEEADAKKKLADAWKEIEDGKRDIAEGEEELTENEKDYQEKRADAVKQLSDAYAELDDIDMTKWYVQDRTSIDSYTGLDTDLISIGVIGNAFPVLFLIVAILISLTTMTRMVEEERSLIGTYKALGFGSITIAAKYLIYALLASIAGGILGNIIGFVVLPKFLFVILNAIYVIPNTTLHFDATYGTIGALLFIVSILMATAIVCQKELRRVPASLMRPKTPRMGARIFLEKLPFIWTRLKFLNKITARNIFRYKKRLIMTIFGIASCTALVLMGFAIRDSVIDLMPRQYDDIDHYDILASANPNDEDEFINYLNNDQEIIDFISYQTYNVKLFNSANASESIYLIVVPNNVDFSKYMTITDLEGNTVTFNDAGIYVTQNCAELLQLKAGDNVTLQTMQLDQYEAKLQDVIQNYLGNILFMTETYYESLIGEFTPNAIYAYLANTVTDQKAYADALRNQDFVSNAISTEASKEQFSSDFVIINFVIYILIVLAACLAFVVLFTLSSTNVSERNRELATIKVLGFYDREIHSYVNKETLLLTVISVLLGMPLGYLFSGLLLNALKMPSIQFVLIIRPQSYLFAGIISFSFTLIVNLITNRMLNKINMVEALKSVE